MPDNKGSSPFQRRYPPEMRERAVRMVAETIAEQGERPGASASMPPILKSMRKAQRVSNTKRRCLDFVA